MKNLILIFLPFLVTLNLCGQSESETIKKNFSFSSNQADNLLVVENINGSIIIEGHDSQQVILEVSKTITHKSATVRQKATEVEVGIVAKDDVIYFYLKNPCRQIDPNTVTAKELRNDRNWNWDNSCKWDPDYEFRFDYKLKVPKKLELHVSTINQGEIIVKNIAGKIEANNINGPITLEHIGDDTKATTINGDVTLLYDKNPSGESRYYSLNGDINAYYQKGLSAEVFFKSFSGDFYTDIDEISTLPLKMKTEKADGDGISYKIGGTAGIKVGKGEAKLEFETFNGDVYVRGTERR